MDKEQPIMKEFIKDVHYYMDGDMVVFTKEYHLQRGKCCNNNCKHCPYKKLKTIKKDRDICNIHDVLLDEDGVCHICLEQSNL